MDLIKITDLVIQLGISSRSLRYYEQAGLIQSVRRESEKYRYYDTDNIERLKQIIVLRKMEIPVKDILRIYESADMSVVVETFMSRIRAIDEEVDALTELRTVVNDFLQAMLQKGITKISALPILYEKMEMQLDTLERRNEMSFQDLSALSDRLVASVNPAIIELPAMRMLSSGTEVEAFWRYLVSNGIPAGKPGQHEQFELQDEVMLRIPDDFVNNSGFKENTFDGGRYASINVYLDEDLGQCFRAVVSYFGENKFYELDYTRASMLENLFSPDEKRELVSLLVPVKKRIADPTLFDRPEEVQEISVDEIEAQNPILWEIDVPLDSLTPINNPHYRVNEQGEMEYTGWISTRVLSTNVKVNLPFRVDLEFRFDEDTARYAYGSDEGAITFHHGDNLNYSFGINMRNRPAELFMGEAIQFHQPIYKNNYEFPNRGWINKNVYNKLTWIVGEKHFAVIINGDVRYCGVNFPYMKTDLSRSELQPIILGSNGQGMKYYKSIRVSQLRYTPKMKMKEGEMSMITKRSNNIIPSIHRFITSELGENYWFNGCGRYVMGALGEKDYDYDFFAGLTGDIFAQVYPFDHFRGDGVTDYHMSNGEHFFIEEVFHKCGYAASFVPENQLKANREMYLQTAMAYIDKGIPVISNLIITGHNAWIVIVGYEEYGKTLLFMTDNMTEPERVSADEVFDNSAPTDEINKDWYRGWIFVGEKKEQKNLKQLYRDVILGLPQLLTMKTDQYCFGAEAFRTWARDIEHGKYDEMSPEDFDGWLMYSTYVCNAATNASCCHGFLDKAMELNPDFVFLKDIRLQYEKMMHLWNEDADSLEALGGGFNVSLEALQNKEKRGKIADKLREFAECADEVVRVLEKNIS